ncbi:MAG: PH domain-containing protein [Bacteroidota bacterium]
MKPSDLSFHSPQRQSPAAVIFILITFLRRSVRRFWFLFLFIFFQKGESRTTYFLGLLIVISVLQLASSLIHYFRFYFYIEGDELILESRRLQTTRTNIPFDRIQTIEFEQGILHRFFNVVKVQIDTAGSEKAEMSLDALEMERAEALRSFILTQKAQYAALTGEEGELVEEEQVFVPTPPQDELLLELEPGELLRVGLAQNHLRTAGIIVGFFLGLYQYVDEFISWDREDVTQYVVGIEGSAVVLTVLGVIPLLLLAAVVVSVVRVVFRYYGFKAWKTARGLKLQAGLLTRREQAATRSKIQLIRWYQTLFELRMGISRVRLFQAAGNAVKKKEALTLPGCHDAHRDMLNEVLLSKEEQLSLAAHTVSRKIILRRVLFRGILPAIGLGIATASPMGYAAGLWILLIPFNIWTARRYHDRFQLLINEYSVQIRSGVWGYRGVILPWYKIQAVRLSSSPFERRHGLSTVRLATAGGTVRIPFVPDTLAHSLADFALYKVESSQKAWM